ncbi:TetR/AcrR family transcriptional regulator [Mucilaginibacter rigui]|uniref:TetR/AcrR family transcriptional regulator n=1 Tax=Mucilaginibacter rigui TaxID=534635 RepID=A0ABR7X356_9SPHI|nr:TetR/AcrR family transcriptional regulator [Mucilaginibacter rigui]MBD1385030.1 TetR/AcrR family transcriptional regulator [Mucilaginibacter rigui]
MSKGESTKQMIIERATPIFNKKGIFGTSMSDIMEAAKLSKGSLYVHFEDKDSLAFAVLEYSLDLQNKKLSSSMDHINDPYQKLLAYLDIYRDPMNPTVPGGCPMMNFGMEADDNFPLVKERVNRAIEMRQKFLQEIIKDGIYKGIFKSDWNYREFATVMFALVQGGIMVCRIAGSSAKMAAIINQLKSLIQAQLIKK